MASIVKHKKRKKKKEKVCRSTHHLALQTKPFFYLYPNLKYIGKKGVSLTI